MVNAATFARAICESEGKEWAGLDNSRADCERWFKAGEACLASLSRGEPEGWRETSGDSDDLNERALRICRREVRKFDERGASLKTDIHAAVKAAMAEAAPAPPSPETE